MLEQDQVQEALEDYVKRFNELIDQSTYFKRGLSLTIMPPPLRKLSPTTDSSTRHTASA